MSAWRFSRTGTSCLPHTPQASSPANNRESTHDFSTITPFQRCASFYPATNTQTFAFACVCNSTSVMVALTRRKEWTYSIGQHSLSSFGPLAAHGERLWPVVGFFLLLVGSNPKHDSLQCSPHTTRALILARFCRTARPVRAHTDTRKTPVYAADSTKTMPQGKVAAFWKCLPRPVRAARRFGRSGWQHETA
jgi:hypothetical protein